MLGDFAGIFLFIFVTIHLVIFNFGNLIRGIYAKRYGRYFLLFAGTIYCFIMNPLYLFIVIALFGEIFVFSNMYDRRYHGECVKLKNIREGKGIIYLFRLVDLKTKDELENQEIGKLVSLFSEVENRNYILAGVKRLLIEHIAMKKWELPVFVDKILELLWEKPREISLNLDEKELDVTILFMYYAIIADDIAEINRVLCVIQNLQKEWGAYSKLWKNYFQWYVEIIQRSRGERITFTVKAQEIMFVKNESIGYLPGKYCNNLRQAELVVKEIVLGQ